MSTTARHSRVLQLLNYRIRITLNDTRQITGTLLAFDKHMNLVIGDADEFRTTKAKQMEKRSLGLVVLRGDVVISLTAISPPVLNVSVRAAAPGVGVAKSMGRGLPVAMPGAVPVGLGGPVRGINAGGFANIPRPPPGFMPQGMPGMPGMPGMNMPPGFPMPPGMNMPPGFPMPPPGFPMPPRPM